MHRAELCLRNRARLLLPLHAEWLRSGPLYGVFRGVTRGGLGHCFDEVGEAVVLRGENLSAGLTIMASRPACASAGVQNKLSQPR